ncbi:MAG: hypothetical protein Q9191_000724 [Dirinaria sp. TL-2023a]
MGALQPGDDRSQDAISILFGPQGALSSDSLSDVRILLRKHPELEFLSSTIRELPSLWPAILDVLPGLDIVPAKKRLNELCGFFQGGAALTFKPTDNILLCPLTVIIQIVDFWKLTHAVDLPSFHASQLQDVQGFCLGFLVAIAASCSSNERQFQDLAAKAVRLALVAGAVVDSDALTNHGCATTIAVRLKSNAHLEHLQHELELFHGTYVSVVTNTGTATITVLERHEALLMSDLAKVNIPAMPLAPRGRWHSRDHLQGLRAILALCQRDERFRLPDAHALNTPLLSNIDGKIITEGKLHSVALQSILTEQSRWDLMFDALLNMRKVPKHGFRHISIGEKVLVPRSVDGASPTKVSSLLSSRHPSSPRVNQPLSPTCDLEDTTLLPKDAIAIIGMACRYPDADSVEEFWDLINEGKCVVKEFPKDRFDPSDLHREPNGPFWGGYLRHLNKFDHRFFGISGREAKSMDPQQRLCLEVAYEAMESSGYYGLRSDEFDREVGCYIGSANDDYFDNVASHPVSAFSLPGTLRSFISGRVSHNFGWTGPSMVLDTACSAAAVAFHTACKVS